MDFKEIENLNQEDIINMYDVIMNFGDDTRLSGCCCGSDYHNYSNGQYREYCVSWCRYVGQRCSGWLFSHKNFTGGCPFSC